MVLPYIWTIKFVYEDIQYIYNIYEIATVKPLV